jgi:CBS-domain-containing membrane protein
MTVQAYADEFAQAPARHRALPVVGWDGTIVGVVTIDRLAQVPVGQRNSVRVQDVALPVAMVGTARPEERLLATAGRFGRDGLGLLLVFDGPRLAGIVTPTDLRPAGGMSAASAVV